MSFHYLRVLRLPAWIGLIVCAACAPLAAPEPTPEPTPTAAATPTDCPTAWSWATGPGSPAFDEQLSAALVGAGLDVRGVQSTGFGENNLCNGRFHPRNLDVLVEIAVADTPDETAVSRLNADVLGAIEGALAYSTIPNLGHIGALPVSSRYDSGQRRSSHQELTWPSSTCPTTNSRRTSRLAPNPRTSMPSGRAR